MSKVTATLQAPTSQQAPSLPSMAVDLSAFSELKTRFTKLDVERTGRIAALANNHVLLLYELEKTNQVGVEEHGGVDDDELEGNRQHHDFIPYKHRAMRVSAIKWNPHHHCRMHLASAKGTEVIVWDLEDTASPSGETTLRKHKRAVMDICWSRVEQNTLVSASNSIFSWDTRVQNRVQEMKVPATYVSFNRKNAHILASAFQQEVSIWDMRKVAKPVLAFPAFPRDAVTSVDWSYESEYDLLTSGGGVVKLWTVVTAGAKQHSSRVSDATSAEGTAVMQDRRAGSQPMQKALFSPAGQAAITTSRGFFEGDRDVQRLKLWSLVPSQRFQMVKTYAAGMTRIMDLSWRVTASGGHQVASLDEACHLRLHDIKWPGNRSTGVHLPVGSVSTGRDYASKTGLGTLEGTAARKTPMIRGDLAPSVWRFSRASSAVTTKLTGDVAQTTADNPLRELIQVIKVACMGGFGDVSNVQRHAGQHLVSMVMIARAEAKGQALSDEAEHEQEQAGRGGSDVTSDDAGDSRGSDGVKYVAVARLLVTAKIPSGYNSNDEFCVIQLKSDGGSVVPIPQDGMAASVTPSTLVQGEDPLNQATVQRMQSSAEKFIRQAHTSRQPRLHACLLKIRGDLTERVRDVACQAAGIFRGDGPNDHLGQIQFDFDEATRDMSSYRGDAGENTLSGDSAAALCAGPIVPCPRRFGANFAPNGTLVVFCSASEVLRVGTDEGRGKPGKPRDQVSSPVYPRSYGSFLECLQKAQKKDVDEQSQGDDIHDPNFEDSIRDGEHQSWSRSSWGYGPDHEWEDQDDPANDAGYSSEDSFTEEEDETLASDTEQDNTRLPISHPDHSLGADLGADSDKAAPEGPTDEDDAIVDDTPNEGLLPWTPKPKQVTLVDCSRYLPGSIKLATFYKLGPLQAPAWAEGIGDVLAGKDATDLPEEKADSLFSPLPMDLKEDFAVGSDASISSGGRSRRDSLVAGSSLANTTGIPPPLTILQRGISGSQEMMARGAVGARRTTTEAGQVAHQSFGGQKQWESSPDFKIVHGTSRGGSLTSWAGRAAALGAGAGIGGGNPAFAGGSPGRAELARAMQRTASRSGSVDEFVVGSPLKQQQVCELADVAEFAHRVGANTTPPRSQTLPEGGLMIPTPGSAAGGSDITGMLSPGATVAWKSSAQNRNFDKTLKWRRKRQNISLPRSPSSGGGVCPPLETTRLRLAPSTRTSSVDTSGVASTSPPMSDVGMDLAQMYAPTFQTAGVAVTTHGPVSRSSSFNVGAGGPALAFVEASGGDGAYQGQPGPGGRPHASTIFGDQMPVEGADGGYKYTTGNRSRSGTDLWRVGYQQTYAQEEKAKGVRDGAPSLGQLCRHNAAVATASGCTELNSVWALLADAADGGAYEEGHQHPAGRGSIGIWLRSSRKRARPRLTQKILAHYETAGDPQTLASVVCVLGSASRNCGNGNMLPKREPMETTHGRYMGAYAERLHQWGAHGVRGEILSHKADTPGPQHSAPLVQEGPEKRSSPLLCVLCDKAVRGQHHVCRLCGHGGHSKHMQMWCGRRSEYANGASECPDTGCTCNCEMVLVRGTEDAD